MMCTKNRAPNDRVDVGMKRWFAIAVVVAGCATSGPGTPAAPTPDGPRSVNAAFVTFQGHALAAYDNFRSLASNLAGDVSSAKRTSIRKDGKALQSLASNEIGWLAKHPAAPCYKTAQAAWKSTFAIVKRAGLEAAALKSSSAAKDLVTVRQKLLAIIDSLDALRSGACMS
ncbi:MAG: hypothetical protein QOJ75_931 [Chloroflexota bacterium]|nr:hypothetical protein [Chloroflexota bacterium]